jgi:hypothetical protein
MTLPDELDASVCGHAKAIWLLLGRTPPLSAIEIQDRLNASDAQITFALHQLRDAHEVIVRDQAHGGYRRDAGDES